MEYNTSTYQVLEYISNGIQYKYLSSFRIYK